MVVDRRPGINKGKDTLQGSGMANVRDFIGIRTSGSASLSCPIVSSLTSSPGNASVAALQGEATPFGEMPEAYSITWPDLSDLTSYTSNSSAFGWLTKYAKIAVTAFSVGLDRLTSLVTSIADSSLDGVNPLRSKLPLLDKSLSESGIRGYLYPGHYSIYDFAA